ncbi:hypothetical protein [Desulfovibrio sp. MES5]|uniref:hypothetical protein n=1 Tax=Desulfovibrio sp. MES5 TaxID=1899016 RepID=UPI0025BE1704|nr:hypothetical protein [Desulfovibrio sp. MES5]
MTYDAFTPASAQNSTPGAASANASTGGNTWLGVSGSSDATANSGGHGGQSSHGSHGRMTGSAAGSAVDQNSGSNSGPNTGHGSAPKEGQNPDQNSAQNGNAATGQELLNRQIEQHMRQHEAARHEQWQKQVSQWREEVAQDPQLGGVHMAANVARAQLALDRFDQGRHIGRLLEESGYGNHPEVLRFFNRVADALMEDSLVRGEPGGGMPPLEERMYAGWSSRK